MSCGAWVTGWRCKPSPNTRPSSLSTESHSTSITARGLRIVVNTAGGGGEGGGKDANRKERTVARRASTNRTIEEIELPFGGSDKSGDTERPETQT
jgi:hypothetical protein